MFDACHKVVPYEPFIQGCEFDVCNMDIDIIGCTSIQTYAYACAGAGVCIDWRNATDGLCGAYLSNQQWEAMVNSEFRTARGALLGRKALL